MNENNNNLSATGIVSLILGILSVIWSFLLPGGALVTLILGVIAICLAVLSRNRDGKNGFATGGLILGIIGIILFVIFLIFLLILGGDNWTIFMGLLFI